MRYRTVAFALIIAVVGLADFSMIACRQPGALFAPAGFLVLACSALAVFFLICLFALKRKTKP